MEKGPGFFLQNQSCDCSYKGTDGQFYSWCDDSGPESFLINQHRALQERREILQCSRGGPGVELAASCLGNQVQNIPQVTKLSSLLYRLIEYKLVKFKRTTAKHN